MGFEERECSRAGKISLELTTGVSLNAFRSYKATTEVYYHSLGAHKTVICCSLQEKITGTYAGIPKQVTRTANLQ